MLYKYHQSRRRVSSIVLIAAVAAIGVVTALPVHAQTPRETFLEAPCPASLKSDAKVRFRCGELKVPEVRTNPASAMLTIPVTIMSPAGAAPDPVVVLHGGPGAPAHAAARARFAGMRTAAVSTLLDGRSWIIFDQRGVGISSPPLSCPLPKSLIDGHTPAEAATCAASLQAQGRALDAYTSITSAQDVEALRRTLGFDRINLYGASYGSRLAFTYARLYPDQVRAIVHDGPYTPAEQEMVDDARGVDAILRGIARRCAATAACAKRYPDLEARFVAGVARLAAQPVNGVTDAFAVTALRDMAFGHEIAPLPKLMDRVARGDTGFLAKQLREVSAIDVSKLKISPQEIDSTGQNWSVDCNEEKTFESKAEYRAARGTSPIIDAFLTGGDNLIDICAVWPSGKADPVENQPVFVAAPQLVLTGEFDASQSGIVGARIVAAMPAARDMIFTDTGHVQIDGRKADCAFGVIGRFFRDLDPKAPAPACVTAPLVTWR